MNHNVNPMTPGTFCRKCILWTFWWFLGWISAKLPLIRLKMRLQHNSLPFLPPASRFSALWLGHAQKSKFWDRFWARKWPMPLAFSIFGIFFALPFSPFLFFLLQWLTFYWACLRLKSFEKASSRQATLSLEQPGVVVGNFALSFSNNLLSIFVHI